MLVQALLQTSLILWLAQQTLQGGIKPQTVTWGRVLPARGVGIGVKPGVGNYAALGSRYGSKAMKTGIGRYPGALGLGGSYRTLGLGGRTGLKQGGYAPQGAYGTRLGTGVGLGVGLPNGLGMGLGHGGKRAHGAGTVPGYGALAGMGYPEARPGGSPADLGRSEIAALGQAVRDLERAKSRALASLFLGNQDRTLGPEIPNGRRTDILGSTVPESRVETGIRPAVVSPGTQVKDLDPLAKAPSHGTATSPDNQSRSLGAVSPAQRRETYEPVAASHGAKMATGGTRQQQPVAEDKIRNLDSARNYDQSSQRGQQARNCGSARDLLAALEMENYRKLLASEAQRTQSSTPQANGGKDSKHVGQGVPRAQGEETSQLPLRQDARTNIFSPPLGQSTRVYSPNAADRQGAELSGTAAKDSVRLTLRGTLSVENHSRGSANPQAQKVESNVPVIPGTRGTDSLGVEGQAGGPEARGLFHAQHDVREPKALVIPEATGRNTQGTSYGAGSYPGTGLGAGGYGAGNGAGLGQGAYLGGAAGRHGAAASLGNGRYPHGGAGKSNGFGDGATGFHQGGALTGNGFGYGNGHGNGHGNGYGNGYGDGYAAGLGYPSELADVAENKAGKSKAHGTGAYAGQPMGDFGALGAGIEATAGKLGKYGGGAGQVPLGGAAVIPAGLEADGGYPYDAQQLNLGGEVAKAANKHGPGAGYGIEHTGYDMHQVHQDAFAEQAGKYGKPNGALGKGYKG